VLISKNKVHKFEKWGSFALLVGVLLLMFDPLSKRIDYNQVKPG